MDEGSLLSAGLSIEAVSLHVLQRACRAKLVQHQCKEQVVAVRLPPLQKRVGLDGGQQG
jgi:hypothetical protein